MYDFDSAEASALLIRIFEWLDTVGIEYCVERNYRGYPETITGDVDLIISELKLIEAARGIKLIAQEMNWFCYQEHIWEKSAYLGFGKAIFPDRFALTIELFAGARWHGIPYIEDAEILKNRNKYGVTWCPRAAHQAGITCIHHLLYNGLVPKKYRNEISVLVDRDLQLFRKTLSLAFGKTFSRRLFQHLVSGNWDALSDKVREMKIILTFRNLLKQPVEMATMLKQGYRAKQRLPEGILLLVYDDDLQVGRDFCQTLLEFANKWHLFLPPVRRIIGDGLTPINRVEIESIHRIVYSGGVAIVNCSRRCQIDWSLKYLPYEVNLDQQCGSVDLYREGLKFADIKTRNSNQYSTNGVAQVWNFVLANRVQND